MDKALVFGTKDCRFESYRGHFSFCFRLKVCYKFGCKCVGTFSGVYSSAVERLTADQQVPGSNPGAPFLTLLAQRLAIAPDAGLRMQVQVVK